MNQGASGVKEVIQGKESKHCFVHVERGSFFTGAGLADFNIDYSEQNSQQLLYEAVFTFSHTSPKFMNEVSFTARKKKN